MSVEVTGYTEISYFPSDTNKLLGVGLKEVGDNIEIQMKVKEGAWASVALSAKDEGSKL